MPPPLPASSLAGAGMNRLMTFQSQMRRVPFVEARNPAARDPYHHKPGAKQPINEAPAKAGAAQGHKKQQSQLQPQRAASSASAAPPAAQAPRVDKDEDGNDLPTPQAVYCSDADLSILRKAPRILALSGAGGAAASARVGPGLQNIGNTCFANAVIQMLRYTPFETFLRSRVHSQHCGIKNGFCLLCAYERHILGCLKAGGRGVAVPSGILNANLRKVWKSYRPGHQHDAHEFMRFLLDALNDCALTAYPKTKHPATQMTSPVSRLFGGYLRSQVRCLECKRGSNTYDPFMDLSLEVARCKSIEHAFAHFTTPEMLEGSNMYRCSRCNIKVRARKQLTLYRTPPVLSIHLKRFEFSGFGGGGLFGGFGGKLNHHVHFPAVLNLSPYVGGKNNGEMLYDLQSVLVHSGGSPVFGHYFSYIRCPATDRWFLMDDSSVQQVSWNHVQSQKAYILLYIQRHVAPPAGDPKAASQPSSAAPAAKPVSPQPQQQLQAAPTMAELQARLAEAPLIPVAVPSLENPTGSTCWQEPFGSFRQFLQHAGVLGWPDQLDSAAAADAPMETEMDLDDQEDEAAPEAAEVAAASTSEEDDDASDDEHSGARDLDAMVVRVSDWKAPSRHDVARTGRLNVDTWDASGSGGMEPRRSPVSSRGRSDEVARRQERREWDEEYDRGHVRKVKAKSGALQGPGASVFDAQQRLHLDRDRQLSSAELERRTKKRNRDRKRDDGDDEDGDDDGDRDADGFRQRGSDRWEAQEEGGADGDDDFLPRRKHMKMAGGRGGHGGHGGGSRGVRGGGRGGRGGRGGGGRGGRGGFGRKPSRLG